MKHTLRKQILGISVILMASSGVYSQRYATEIYTDAEIEVISDVVYGTNIRFFPPVDFTSSQAQQDVLALQTIASTTGEYPAEYFNLADGATTVKIQNLLLDIYQPMQSVDETEDRPLIIYLHTGNFLPPPTNGSPNGTKTDSLAIVACRQWAKRGFVAASVSYRLGWNPIGNAQERRGTLLNAVYRAIQDTKEAVRFLKEDAAGDNTYAIDSDKIVLFGEGSGGYVALAYATVDDLPAEIEVPKFIHPGTGESYVNPANVGDENGFNGGLSLYRDNGQNGDINMVVNAGGALGEITWLEAGDVPMVSFHTIRDDFAPFDDGTVIVPTTEENVVDVSGPNVFIQAANDLGNNDAFAMLTNNNDPFTQQAESLYGTGPYETSNDGSVTISSTPHGLYPIVLPLRPFLTNIASPWQWWNPNSPLATAIVDPETGITAHQASMGANPNMSPTQGRTYLDTIQGYAIPRIMCVLELEGNACTTGLSELEAQNNTTIFPNPSQSAITIRNSDELIRRIQMIDITGRVVLERNVNDHTYRLERGQLSDGVYLLQVTFDNQQITKKVLLN